MRIVHVTDVYAPTIGGLERAVEMLALVQAAVGHDVTVVAASHPDAPAFEVCGGVEVYRIPMLTQKLPGALGDPTRPFHPTLTDPLFRRGLRRLFDRLRPDVVHTHDWVLYSALGPARRSGAAVVHSMHEYGQVCPSKSLQTTTGHSCEGKLRRCLPAAIEQYGLLRGAALTAGLLLSSHRSRKVHLFTGVSQTVVDAGAALLRRDRTAPSVVVPSYVPDAAADLARGARPEFLPDGEYLLFVGALGPHKGLDVALAAHTRLRERGHDLSLVVIGTRRHDTPDLDLPGVVSFENVPHAQVMAAWAHATVGLIPSRWQEPFGQVGVEVGLAGTPAVAAASGGLADIVVDGKTGLLVPPGDVEAFAAAVGTLLEDRPRAAAMGAAAARHAHRYTVSMVAPQIEEVYRRAVAIRDARVSSRSLRAPSEGTTLTPTPV